MANAKLDRSITLDKRTPDKDPAGLTLGGRLRFLARDSAVYGLAAAISRFASLLTFPIVVRHLTLSEYGVLDILQVFGSLLTVFLILGQDSAVARYFFEHKDVETQKEMISQSLLSRLAVAVLMLPLVWLSGDLVISALGIDPHFRTAFDILLLQAPFIVLLNFAVVLLRVTFARNRFILLSVGFSFTQAGCWLLAIFLFDASVQDILLAGLVATVLFAALGLVFIRGWLHLTLRVDHTLQMLPYALPYGAISALRALTPLVERALVVLLLTGDALGLYAAGAKITMLYALFAFAFQAAWEPFALSISKRPDAHETYNLVLKIFILLACILVLVLTGLAQPIILVLAGEKYLGATVIIFPMLFALALESISWITEIGLILRKKTSLKLVAYLFGAATSVLGIFLLAPDLGLEGVAVAVLLGSIVKTVTVTLLARRMHDLRWSIAAFVVLLPTTMLLGTWVGHASGSGTLAALGACGAAILLLIVLAYALVLSGEERARLSVMLRRGRLPPPG